MDLKPALGASTSFSKTVSESDVYLFAGVTGDLAPNHVDEQFMRKTPYGRRIAHGALLVGYMSTASTMVNNLMAERVPSIFPVSLGYDKVRFLKPVFLGDTITVRYIDPNDPTDSITGGPFSVYLDTSTSTGTFPLFSVGSNE